jgi:predicted dehydrogenase
MGPYYLSAIVNLLGPIAEVRAVSGTGFPTRTAFCGPHAGENISVETPTYYSALLTLRSGVMLNFNISFDIWHSSLPMLELYGTEGTLTLPDPNMTSGMPKLFRKEQALRGVYQGTADTEPQQPFAVPDCCPEYGEYIRGVGVCELADAMETGREPRAGAALALHVTEGILGIMESARQGKPYFLQTTWERVE